MLAIASGMRWKPTADFQIPPDQIKASIAMDSDESHNSQNIRAEEAELPFLKRSSVEDNIVTFPIGKHLPPYPNAFPI